MYITSGATIHEYTEYRPREKFVDLWFSEVALRGRGPRTFLGVCSSLYMLTEAPAGGWVIAQLSQPLYVCISASKQGQECWLVQIVLIPEVVVALAHHGGQVRVPAHERQRLARRHVEVAGHLVQAEGAVDAARVRRLVGGPPPASVRIIWDTFTLDVP